MFFLYLNSILCDLLQSIRQEMDIIYDLTGHISELDITLAIVKVKSIYY